MTWLKKDDRFSEHRKIRRLCDGARFPAAWRTHPERTCGSKIGTAPEGVGSTSQGLTITTDWSPEWL